MENIVRNKKLEKKLFDFLTTEDLKKHFTNRLNIAPDSYWQTISEMRTVVIFNNFLKIKIKDVESKTVKEKSVDIVGFLEKNKIYIEVKGFRPQNLNIAKKGGLLGIDENKISRALLRSKNKFFSKTYNIVVIADEDTIKPSLFEDSFVDMDKTPEKYLDMEENRHVSAVMILGGFYDKQLFKYKIWYGANTICSLPDDLKMILNKYKSNE
ncbi:MAG: hypothetical protein KAV41_01680 [Candidatus Pacebacteria bacterium]|nr:hypothetical protein [Candidatus Paceibacterota bacterium]